MKQEAFTQARCTGPLRYHDQWCDQQKVNVDAKHDRVVVEAMIAKGEELKPCQRFSGDVLE